MRPRPGWKARLRLCASFSHGCGTLYLIAMPAPHLTRRRSWHPLLQPPLVPVSAIRSAAQSAPARKIFTPEQKRMGRGWSLGTIIVPIP
jgi:hypothetical protein